MQRNNQIHSLASNVVQPMRFCVFCQRQITRSGSEAQLPIPSIIVDSAYQTSFKFRVILEGMNLATGLCAAVAVELLSAARIFAHTLKAALQETGKIDAKLLLITLDI